MEKIGQKILVGKIIGKTFQNGFDKCQSDWVIRMDIDYFFHEQDFKKIRKALDKFWDYPMIALSTISILFSRSLSAKTRID